MTEVKYLQKVTKGSLSEGTGNGILHIYTYIHTTATNTLFYIS
jgi:hypothetical protein